jgi:hypothetical protein
MNKKLFALALMPLVGCAHAQISSVELTGQAPFGVVAIDNFNSYMIDPRTESCFLRSIGSDLNFAMVPVSCAKLRKSVPESAQYITWESNAAPAEKSTAAAASTP